MEGRLRATGHRPRARLAGHGQPLGYTLSVSGVNTKTQPVDATQATARCVVWQPASLKAPRGLLAALESKGLELARAGDPYSALAQVLSASRARQVVVLVIVEPSAHARCDEVLAALDRFAPRAARWTYDPSQQPPLQLAKPRAKAAPTAEPRPTSDPIAEPKPRRDASAPSGPMLRLTGLGVLGMSSFDGGAEPANGSTAESVLTSEEMAALLSDDSFEHDPAGGGQP